MIFGRKKRQAEESTGTPVDDRAATADAGEVASADATTETEGDSAEADLSGTQTDGTADEGVETEDSGADAVEVSAVEADDLEADDVEDEDVEEIDADELDAQDWRTEGPWDSTEVDPAQLEAGDDQPRIDLGSLLLTGVEGMELQLQVAEDTQQIVSAMMVMGQQVVVDDEVHELNSALEVAAFAAPRSPGFWSEIREEILEGATEAGGSAGLTAGPFGVEVRRMMLLETPDGEQGYQPSRMWVVEGPRWILRGVVYGHAALDGVPGDHVEQVADVFRQIIVRRGDDPMSPGDLLPLRLPENMVEETTEE